MIATVITLVILCVISNSAISLGQVYFQPEQVHLSIGADVNSMVATWVTKNATQKSVVQYGKTTAMNLTVLGNATLFIDGGRLRRFMYIHRAAMIVEPGETYFYHVGSPVDAWSAVFYFKALPSTTDWSPRIALYGDLGNANSRSLASVQGELQRGLFDATIHVGDIAYDLDTNDALVGDEFMRMIEGVAAYAPYMTCPGNHEEAYNFSNYVNRFSMPAESYNTMFYSFNMGPAHFISINTEYYYYGYQYGFDSVTTQYNWLIADLKEANKPENRNQRPWIITFGHRPMYCGNNQPDDCKNLYNHVRSGYNSRFVSLCGLEDLLLEFGVDLEIWGHKHSYERMWPVYNATVRNGTTTADNSYDHPNAPVHLTTGSAGCDDGVSPFGPTVPHWSAFHTEDWGYSTLNVINKTHLNIKQYSVDQDKVIDNFWIVKSQPYPSYFGEITRIQKQGGPFDDATNRTLECTVVRAQQH